MQGLQVSSFQYDSFTRVSPRKKRRGQNKGAATTPSNLLTRAKEELTTDGEWSASCRRILHEALGDARVKPQKVLCLGLGSPCSSRDARAQLALLSDLCASSDVDSADVSLYDPAFTDADRALLQTLGMQCLDRAQGMEHSLDCPTILYMPHCDLKLYEMVVRANWTLEGLCKIVLLANRFGYYIDSMSISQLEKESPCLMRLAPFLECRPLPLSQAFPNAFSSLSLQYVRRTPLLLQDHTFWETPPCSNSVSSPTPSTL